MNPHGAPASHSRQGPHAADIDPFFESAAELRLSLSFNSGDYDFATSGGRVVYLVDANVVRFFLNPEEERDRMHVFGPGEADNYAGATALIAAEFMFSRGLAGQGDSPALIAPAHGDDLQGIVAQLLRDARNAPHAPDNALDPLLRTQIHELVDGARKGDLSRPHVVKELQKLVPSAAKQLLAGATSAVAQLARLHEEDLLRPLALHTAATRDIMTLDAAGQQRAAQWEQRLQEQYRVRGRQMDEHNRRLIKNDAEALTQLQLLSEAADPARVRYVMITADRALYDAYADWYWGRADQGREQCFLLRSLLQYAPILNVQEMPNGIERSDLLIRARAALDGLLMGYREVDRAGYPQRLALVRVLARGGVSDLLKAFYGYNPLHLREQDRPLVAVAGALWRDGFRTSIVVNAELMTRRLRAEIALVADLLREQSDLRTALYAVTQDVLARAERAHLNLNTRVNLKLLVDRRAGVRQPPRARLPVSISFPSIIGSLPLEEALDRLAGNDQAFLSKVTTALRAAVDEEAFLFTACLAIRCGQWYSAWHHAIRALTMLGTGDVATSRRAETSLLVAFAARYALPSADALGQAIGLLEQVALRARARSDHLSLARALSEHTALMLVLLYAAHLSRRLPRISLPSLPLPEAWRPLVAEARRAAERSGAERPLLQLDANTVAAALLARRLKPSLAAALDPGDDELERALTRLAPLLADPDCPLVLSAEAAILLGKPIESILSRGGAPGVLLTELDRAEMQEFAELTSERGQVPAAQMAD